MRADVLKISDQLISETSHDTVPTKTAWAAYVRRRWPENCLAHVQREWSLSEGEGRGVVFGSVSQRTIDKILAHRNGGVRVELAVAAIKWGTTTHGLLSRWAQLEEGAARDERERGEAAERRVVALARRLRVVGDGGGDSAGR